MRCVRSQLLARTVAAARLRPHTQAIALLIMKSINYNKELLGFIVKEGGISLELWDEFARRQENYKKTPPKKGINPFTGKEHFYHSNSYLVLENNTEIGLLAWEESECIGVAGKSRKLESEINKLNREFDAVFETCQS